MITSKTSKFLWIAFFVTPALLIVSVFILLPLFMSLFNSLFNWNQLLRGTFTGLGNFKKLFFTFPYNERFFNALKHNGIWFCCTMLIQNSLGLLFGYVLSRKIAGHGAFKRIFFIPVLFSIVAVGFLWGMYLKSDGLVNSFLNLLDLSSFRRAWLGDENTATFAIIATNIWRWVGFPSLVFLAAIDSIDQSCIEAAYIDGVSEMGLFWKIIFPLIIPSVTVITVLTVIGSLNVFEQIYTMTDLGGGPNYSTDTIGTLFYRTAFGSVDTGNPEIGIGSTIAVIIYIMTFCISLVSVAIGKAKETQV
ncbi:MAG: carbohydrate ABC transporter permease [Treponema sp.]|jgi:binding-protein-dependent transport system inner membrane component|uniref:carbohydrate ABC transporter permease n=1 Tax=unclassified Treponema TaxID=2638727 RepID=UPI0020A31A25|nr:sugar ABC transporter permease [Treponema sp. OMZ 906]UTC54802.1 sugar ABC transporter permease [Treponema sp. OMZ 906]